MNFRLYGTNQCSNRFPARARQGKIVSAGQFTLPGMFVLAALFLGDGLLATAASSSPTWPDIRRRIAKSFPQVPAITTVRLARWLGDDKRLKPVLLDVRSREEYEISHLPGAVWAETEKQQRAVLDGQPPARPVVLYCSVGWRSARAADRLLQGGGRTVWNLDGSIFQWANEARPLVDAANKTTHHVHPYDRSWGSLLERRRWSHDPSS